MALVVKNLTASAGDIRMWVQSLGQEDLGQKVTDYILLLTLVVLHYSSNNPSLTLV